MAEDTNNLSPALNLDTSQFRREVSDVDRLGKGLSRNLSRAFVDIAVSGKSLGDVVSTLGQRLARLALSSALKPLEQGFSGLLKSVTQGLGGLFSGNGNASGENSLGPAAELTSVSAFAQGGVISTPTFFPMNNGLGLAGEAGAEAILPLGRGPDGRLGVRGFGGGEGQSIVVNIQTPDVESFRRSEAEISATFARMVGRGQRAL